MKASMKSILAAIAGGMTFALASVVAGSAIAGGCNCSPPPCCAPPSPPPPPSFPCCQPPGHTVNIPGVTVNIAASVIVNANVQAQANVNAAAQSQGAVFVGGGGGASGVISGTPGLIGALNVDNGGLRRAAYEATRTKITKVIIEAVCLDDKRVPHPASQLSPDRDIDEVFEGELYRCIAGTWLQATIADYHGQISFDHGWTMDCAKGDALYRDRGGKLECRAQKPARDCNERSLLRRFGAGVKILTMITTEKYTAYREEVIQSSSSSALSLDGGVGGITY
jgi:hypothetical protein